MLVEVLGLPGSGKTTLVKKVLNELRTTEFSAEGPSAVSARPMGSTISPRYVTRHPDRKLLFRALKFRLEHKEFFACLEDILDDNITANFLFNLTSSYYQSYLENIGQVDFCLIDEGLLQRGVAAFLKSDEGIPGFQKYLNFLPTVDTLIYLKLPADIAFDRAVKRRSHLKGAEKKVTSKFGDVEMFNNRKTLMEMGVAFYNRKKVQIITVDTTQPIEKCVQFTVDSLLKRSQAS